MRPNLKTNMSLEQLAREIKGALTGASDALKTAEERYKEAGRFLMQAKASLGLGPGRPAGSRALGITWEQWLKANVGISRTTADKYVGIAKGGCLRSYIDRARAKKAHYTEKKREAIVKSVAAGTGRLGASTKATVVAGIVLKLWTMSLKDLKHLDKQLGLPKSS